MINYYDLGASKRLSDIVFAGSHDASITGGSSNAQTQDLDIAGQAAAGVRLFDLRILAAGSAGGASLVGYHGSAAKAKTLPMANSHTNKTYDLKVSKTMSTGTFGLKLSEMLTQARDFVTGNNEFLIFKFDKSTNYQVIAEYCATILGNAIYKPIGKELGKCTLGDLKNKVICVFNESGKAEVKGLDESDGILGYRNLKDKGDPKPYMAGYAGLQYFGKGGTDPLKFWKTDTGKIDENVSKQKKLMLKMASAAMPQAADVLGMMYWTSTGLLQSIESRNNTMWGATGVRRMKELWNGALKSAVKTQLELDKIKCMSYGGKRRIKAFFPNIVMIDFADPGKCQTIHDLNHVVEDKLIAAYDQSVEMGFA